MNDEQYAALVAQQERLQQGLKAINEERTRRGMLPTCMFHVLAPAIGMFQFADPVRRGGSE